MSAVRSLISLVLLTLAAITVLLGVTAQWLDRLARTPEPAQAIVEPVAKDAVVIEAVADEMVNLARQQLPSSVDSLPELRPQIEKLLGTAASRALADPGVDQAWRDSFDTTRTTLVADLDRYCEDKSVTPTVWLDLEPFVDLGKAKLTEEAGPRLRPYLENLEWAADTRVPLGTPSAGQAQFASEALGLARLWVWFYVAAGVLALLGLVAGSRKGRWIAWILASMFGLVAVVAARVGLGMVDVASSSSIRTAVTGLVAEGLAASLLEWTALLPWLFAGAAALGVVGVAVAAMTDTRERRV